MRHCDFIQEVHKPSTTLHTVTLHTTIQLVAHAFACHAFVHMPRKSQNVPTQLTDHRRNDDHHQKVEVGNASELLEQILRQECDHRVLGRLYAIVGRPRAVLLLVGEGGPVAADANCQQVAHCGHTIALRVNNVMRKKTKTTIETDFPAINGLVSPLLDKGVDRKTKYYGYQMRIPSESSWRVARFRRQIECTQLSYDQL